MRVTVAALAIALCACGREPSFDERYSESEKEIVDRARELDAQINVQEANGVARGEQGDRSAVRQRN